MIYKSFEITNYKAIQNLKIELSGNNLIPIIGLNETGKSSILEAIALFDYKKGYDSYSEIKNKFFEKNVEINIKANILLNENYNLDIEKLVLKYIEKIKNSVIENYRISIQNKNIYRYEESKILDRENFLKTNFSELFSRTREIFENWYNEMLNKKENVIARKIFEEGWNYTSDLSEIEDLGVEQYVQHYEKEIYYKFNEFDLKMEFLKYLVDNLPVIIYTDDFKDKIPRKINKDTDEWYMYVNEMLKAHSEENINIETFYRKGDKEQKTLLKRISKRLNKNLISKWDELHKDSLSRKDFENSEINLDYNNGYFTFSISDNRKKAIDEFGEYETESVYFEVDQRSKGFQWFFNFFVKLYYNYKYNEEEYQSIILLDEPGVYLHSDFQKELLEILKIISRKNKVFYTTHLENMVNPKIIKINQIYIAKRKDEKITLERITKIENNKNLGEITPVINALKINNFPLLYNDKKIIITEGMSDKIFIELIKEANLLDKNIIVIPGTGVSNLQDLISLFIGISNEYTVIFDSDKAGKEFFKKYKDIYGENESKKWVLHELKNKKENVEIEDYYSDKMNEILKTYAKDLKTGIVDLYYDDSGKRKCFIEEIQKINKSKSDINILIEKIKSKLNSK